MKKIGILIVLVAFGLSAKAQETVGEKVLKNAKDKTYQRGEQKGDETVEGALTKAEEKIKNIFKKKDKKKKTEETENAENQKGQMEEQASKNASSKSIKKNSKFDFEPGQKELAFDDFSTTNIGDFPMGWNTNSSAEIVTLDDSSQKWLSMTKDGFFQPEYVNNMPENFTLEFDVFTRYNSNNLLTYSFYLNAAENPKKDLANKYIQNGIYFGWRPCVGAANFIIYENSEEVSKNEDLKSAEFTENDCNQGSMARISIWRQKTRLRVYINETKILDLPQAFDSKQKYNVFKMGGAYMNYSNGRENDDEFMISNIRYAVAGEDTRSKLITEGRFVTNGILFDVNSDNIKPESGVVLKEIAQTLQENPTVRVKIIGHTDSDGDDKTNMSLSQKRAMAVKNALANFYGIDLSRLETDGKGESQPLNNNAKATQKAQNRRVEFIKL